MREKKLKVGKLDLQIQEFERKADAIFFLHFSGANLMMWQRSLPFFKDHFHIILVDLKGHGRSSRSENGYHMDEMASEIVGVMDCLNIKRAHIVGSSLGAEVGLSLAANHSEKVISLVCDGALSSEFGPFSTWEGTQHEYEEHVEQQLKAIHERPDIFFPSIDALVDHSRKIFGKYGWWNEYFENVDRYGAFKVEEGKYIKGLRKQAFEDYMKHYFHYRFEDCYKNLKCPLLMIPGEETLKNERETKAMQELCQLAPQGRIAGIRGWEHPYGWLLDPGGVSREILDFLGKVV